MNKLNQTGKWAIVGVIVVIAVVLIIVYGGQGQGTPPAANMPNASSSNASNTAASNSGANVSSTGKTTGGGTTASNNNNNTAVSPAPPAVPIITFITPVPGDTWKIATANPIAWSHEAGVTGEIALLDATTMKLVGVILNQVDVHQTSYAWNTRDLYLSRTDPSKTTVKPGRYVIRISFDGNHLSPITSQPLTIQ